MGGPTVETHGLSRSCNEALVFAALEAGPKHGYQLALEVEERGRGAFGFKHGTLYPILHRLEKEGLIEGEWSDEGPKGKRKRYRLTQRGKLYARAQRESWRFFIERFLEVIGEVER